MYMQEILKEDGLSYEEAFSDKDYRPIVEQWSLEHLGYIIRPENLFRELNRRIVKPKSDADKTICNDLQFVGSWIYLYTANRGKNKRGNRVYRIQMEVTK